MNKQPLPMVLIGSNDTYTEAMAHFTAMVHSRTVKIGSALGNERFNPAVSAPELIEFATNVSKLSGASYPLHHWAKTCVVLGYEPSDEEIKAMDNATEVLQKMITDTQKSYDRISADDDNEKILELMEVLVSAVNVIFERTGREIVERQNEIDRANWFQGL